MSDNCGLTRKETTDYVSKIMNLVSNQFKNSSNVGDKIIWATYEQVHTKIFMYIISNKDFDAEFWDEIKSFIHLSSSVISKSQEHIHDDIRTNEEFLFGFYYGIIDTLYEYEEWGFMSEEKEDND